MIKVPNQLDIEFVLFTLFLTLKIREFHNSYIANIITYVS